MLQTAGNTHTVLAHWASSAQCRHCIAEISSAPGSFSPFNFWWLCEKNHIFSSKEISHDNPRELLFCVECAPTSKVIDFFILCNTYCSHGNLTRILIKTPSRWLEMGRIHILLGWLCWWEGKSVFYTIRHIFEWFFFHSASSEHFFSWFSFSFSCVFRFLACISWRCWRLSTFS